MAESPFDNVEFPPYDALPFQKGDPKGNYSCTMTYPSAHVRLIVQVLYGASMSMFRGQQRLMSWAH